MLAGALLALSACAAGPDYRPSLPSVPVAYENQAALAARNSSPSAPPLESWWTGFDDPELLSIIRRVLAQNLDVAASIARVAQALSAIKAPPSVRRRADETKVPALTRYPSMGVR